MLASKFRLFGYQNSEAEFQHQRFHPGIFQTSGGEIHLDFLDTDMVNVTTLLPGDQQHLHKNYHLGQNLSLLMGFFQNAG